MITWMQERCKNMDYSKAKWRPASCGGAIHLSNCVGGEVKGAAPLKGRAAWANPS